MIDILSKEVVDTLNVLGYDTKLEETEKGVVIKFHVTNGSDSFAVRHRKLISMLCGGYLSEFYYANDTQYIYLSNTCNGLEPDDDRYSCVLYEMNTATTHSIEEIFILKPDRCHRVLCGKTYLIE